MHSIRSGGFDTPCLQLGDDGIELLGRGLQEAMGKKIETGVFGADMKVSLINDGPVTILIDSKRKE